MRIEMIPVIIGDDGTEIRKNDTVMMRTRGMDEEGLAIINDIDATMITATFLDIIYGGKTKIYRTRDIKSIHRK